jgi:hypothetical protein
MGVRATNGDEEGEKRVDALSRQAERRLSY